MPHPLSKALDELYAKASDLDAELTRSRTLLDHLPLPLRFETILHKSRRLMQLEEAARLLGLPIDDVLQRRPE